jgi:Helix-turn-helix domain
MAGHGEKFSRHVELAIGALLQTQTLADAAQILGIGERTLRRWMKRPDFQGAYRAARQQAVAQAITRLQQITGKAVTTLEAIIDNEDAPAGARVGAAKAILELTTKSFALEDLREQIAELEARLQEQERPHARVRAAR